MRRIFLEIFNGVERKVNNCMGRPVPNDQVASRGMRNIGNVGNVIDNDRRDSRLGRTLRQILSIRWGGDEVPGEIGTCLVNSRCLGDQFPVRRCSV